MIDKNISAEREATDRLRSELSSVLGKIMGLRAFRLNKDRLKDGDTKKELQKIEVHIQSALRNHNNETHAARFDLVPDAQEEIRLALQHGMEGR